MNKLVVMKNQQAVTTSLAVAQAFGKNHRDVLEAIRTKISTAENSALLNMFVEDSYTATNGKRNKMYYMNRDGFTFIAMGFTGRKADEFKLKYIQAFNAMEEQIRNQQRLPQSPTEMLKLVADSTLETAEKVKVLSNRMDEFEQNALLDSGEYGRLTKEINAEVNYYISVHHLELNQKQRSQLYKDINRGIHEVTGVSTRTQLRKKDWDIVHKYLRQWTPSAATLVMIDTLSDEAKGQERLF